MRTGLGTGADSEQDTNRAGHRANSDQDTTEPRIHVSIGGFMEGQVEGAPTHCSRCSAALCIRKQVINLALGNVEVHFCLKCLAENEDQTPEKLISGMVGYIMGRDCFRKEWVRYKGIEDCPEPTTCIPQTCFNKSDEQARP